MTADEHDDFRHLKDDGIDVEEDGNDESPVALDIEPRSRHVRTDKRDLPVETLEQWVTRGKLDLQPEFQRFFVWNRSKASRLIESLLLEVPIPVIYVAEQENGTFDVVDGQQRLTSITSFIAGRFPDGTAFTLGGLQVLPELNGKSFKELDKRTQEILLSSSIRLIVILKESHPDVQFEVFERLNVGAVKLNDQELRNCVYRGTYNDLLSELTDNRTFQKILKTETLHQRMQDRQLVLRFFAFWRNTHLKYRGPMKQFLNHEMAEHRNLSPDELLTMREVFNRCVEMAWVVFGENAFRRYRPGNEAAPGRWEGKLNVALWDTVLYNFSFYEKAQIVPVADAIREAFLDLLYADAQFAEYISSTTDKADRIAYRGDRWRERLGSVVSAVREPRSFSRQLKEDLFKSEPTCLICDQRIQSLDDSEVDHIEHYWRGGKTIPSNARLTHRYCNRQRGGRA